MSTDTSTATSPGTDLRPIPVADECNAFYWDAAAEGRLVLQRCDRCRQLQYPPDVVCVHCQSTDMTPEQLSGNGRLYSFTIVERSFHPGWTCPPAYVVGLVELAEQAGLRMLTNIVDVDPAALAVGDALEVTFERRERTTLPQFRPAGSSAR